MENSINITGRLTEDIQLKPLKSGDGHSALFTIACQRDFKNKKTGNYDADFFTVAAFNHNAEVVSKYLGKGDAFTIEGKLQSYHRQKDDGSWENNVQILLVHPEFIPSNNNHKQVKPSNSKATQSKHDFSGTPDNKQDPFKEKANGKTVHKSELPF